MIDGDLLLRPIAAHDVEPIVRAFAAIGWNKPATQYWRYLAEQQADDRRVIVALADGAFTGYLTIAWRSQYPPFVEQQIPEIQDFNVLPHARRRGIGSRLMDEAEAIVATCSPIVGIGVGLHAGYGAAQRLYVRRGYIPDGRGLMWRNQPVAEARPVPVDDDLVLYFTKSLNQPSPRP